MPTTTIRRLSSHRLPRKPSALIRLALGDLKACEGDPRYVIDMGSWVKRWGSSPCYVCLAGAVMAQRLKAMPERDSFTHITPTQVSTNGDADALMALNHFRFGDVLTGLCCMGVYRKAKPMHVPDYDRTDPRPFHTAMRRMARNLARRGL